jgi:transposase
MTKRNHGKVTFKPYCMEQLQLPTDIEALIPEKHLVRVVNNSVERMKIDPLLDQYKGGGTSSYHPKMMLKVLIYAYTQKLYSSRQIAKALRENIHFMWISGNNTPDFRTINRFRSSQMKAIIDEVFKSVLELLIEDGYVQLENYFLDGTKIEANANKYSWVWAKTTKNYKEKVQARILELMDRIEKANQDENERYGDNDLEELGSGPIDEEKIEKKIQELNERLAKKTGAKKEEKDLKKIETDYLPRLKRYQEQESKLAGRNSYSKTDVDATFMRMKEDHMKNGQLKPGYNVQIGTENQFIVGYSIHQNRTDTGCLIPHLEHFQKMTGRKPKNIIADAGYGSEENYEYIESKQIEAYVKYNEFYLEQKRKFKKNPLNAKNWKYDEKADEFICCRGKHLKYIFTRQRKSDLGYISQRRVYECEDCSNCPLKSKCTRSIGNRRMEVGLRLNMLKEKATQNLLSDKGKKLRSQRAIEVETAFGMIKHNWSFRRFMLRGIDKVKTEWGLLSIAHNLAKLATN